jgi:hypothetical protein
MKKIFTEKTLFIEDGKMLEEVKDYFVKNNLRSIWGFDTSYEFDATVSSGYLHFDGLFYLSKLDFDKPVITFDELKN